MAPSISAVARIWLVAPASSQPAKAGPGTGIGPPPSVRTSASRTRPKGMPKRKRTWVAPTVPSLPVKSRCMALRAVCAAAAPTVSRIQSQGGASGASVIHRPAPRRDVVGIARLDPAIALGRPLLLPEGRARLEIVHDELARGEGIAAMPRQHHDQHDLVAGSQLADAMDHEARLDRPALGRLATDRGERGLGHARIVLERHGIERGAAARCAHRADEARDGA